MSAGVSNEPLAMRRVVYNLPTSWFTATCHAFSVHSVLDIAAGLAVGLAAGLTGGWCSWTCSLACPTCRPPSAPANPSAISCVTSPTAFTSGSLFLRVDICAAAYLAVIARAQKMHPLPVHYADHMRVRCSGRCRVAGRLICHLRTRNLTATGGLQRT